MKKTIIMVLILSMLIPNTIFSAPIGYRGGVRDENNYEEIVFISGKPVKFVGTVRESISERSGRKTASYTINLESEDKSLEGRLSRRVTYTTELNTNEGIGQTTGSTTVTSFSERINFGRATYTLREYEFSKAEILDSRPAADFYSGTFNGRKMYEYSNRDLNETGKVYISFTGGDVGYGNFWGTTETQIADYLIEKVVDRNEDHNGYSWSGTYSHQVSDSMSKSLRYSNNNTNLSSFHGGHMRVTDRSIVSKYDYSLPSGRRSISLRKDMLPRLEGLIVPKFRDVNGHWAEDNIKKLYSLDVFEGSESIFAPDAPMTRLEFTKAIMRASDIRASMDSTTRTTRTRNTEPSYFKDIETSHPDYQYIKGAVDKGIVSGVSSSHFNPKGYLTRAEAITILIRALGFEHRAPNPGYKTNFSDDRDIPSWAKDSIYVAREINLVQGDNRNRVNPNQSLTRAEVSTLIVRFLEFLERDLQRDYRENIINY